MSMKLLTFVVPNGSTSLDADTLQSPSLRLPTAPRRDEASQACTAAKGAVETGTAFGVAGGVLDFLVDVEGITAVGTGVDDSTESHGSEEEGCETGEELHFDRCREVQDDYESVSKRSNEAWR